MPACSRRPEVKGEPTIGAPAADLIKGFIVKNLPLVQVPDRPDIVLHRAAPSSGLWRLAESDPDFGNPYWAYEWGGGLALARYLEEKPEDVPGKRVLDLGAGSGLVAIAAAKAGASCVLAADIDPYAVAAIELNAAANAVAITPLRRDLLDENEPLPQVEAVLIGDLFYEVALAARTMASLERFRAAGIEVLIGDPGRESLPIDRLRLVAEYPGPDFGSAKASGQSVNSVYALR